jgi:hypothetical protein
MAKKIDIGEIGGVSITRIIRLGFVNFRLIFNWTILGTILGIFFTVSPFMEKSYLASGFIAHSPNASISIQNTIINAITSAEFAESVALQLEEGGIESLEGLFLSAESIQNSLNAVSVPDPIRIKVSFSYPDEILSIALLNEIIDQSINFTNTTYPNLGNGVVLSEYATTSTLEGLSSTEYIAIGSLIGFILGAIIGVIVPALKYTIYSIQDVKEFELSSFYLKLNVKKLLNLDHFLNFIGLGKKINFEHEQNKLILQGLVSSSSFTTIQNNLESTRNKPEEPLTTLMVTPNPSSSLTMVAFAYARQSSTQGRKTIIIDFDLKDVPFTKYLETHQIEAKKKSTSKEGVTFLSLEENLDLYLPLQDIIPAKVIRDENTQEIITQIKKKYDHIIILGPSLLPDDSNISILNYVNSALIILKASKATTMELFKSVNLLIDNQLTAIETLVVEEKIQIIFPSLSEINSWFAPKSKPIVEKPLPKKPSKKN